MTGSIPRALQPDGKIVGTGEAGQRFGLARYNANGTLDTSFDGDGKVVTQFGLSEISSMAIQPDGKILTGGRNDGGGGSNFLWHDTGPTDRWTQRSTSTEWLH